MPKYIPLTIYTEGIFLFFTFQAKVADFGWYSFQAEFDFRVAGEYQVQVHDDLVTVHVLVINC